MKRFRVLWEIDISAEDERAAALRALEIQRDPESIATHFRVREIWPVERTVAKDIDFYSEEENERGT